MSLAIHATRSERAQSAMAHLPEHDPTLASLALWCDIVDAPGTTRSSGNAILIGPEFATLALREQIGVLGHHILHIALRHASRMNAMGARMGRQFSTKQFNLAADALVNSVLEAGGHALPRPAVTLSTVLRDVLSDTENHITKWDVERLYVALETQKDQDNGKKLKDYIKIKAFQPDLDQDDAPADASKDAEFQAHIVRAVQSASGAGRGIGSVLANLADIPRSGTPWNVILRRLLANAFGSYPRLSYSRPRRSWIASDALAHSQNLPAPVFQPGVSRDGKQPHVVVGLDSSSSVSDAILHQFAGEVSGIVRRVGAKTTALLFDEQVYERIDLSPAAAWKGLANMPVRRDGGTSFVDVIEQANSMDPSIIVVLSDLEGPFGPAPSHPVVWATPSTTWTPPPFGTVISLAR